MEQKWSVPWSLLGSSWSYSRFHHPPLASSVLCSPPCRCKTDAQWNKVVFYTVLVLSKCGDWRGCPRGRCRCCGIPVSGVAKEGQWGQLPPPLAENNELHCILLYCTIFYASRDTDTQLQLNHSHSQ